MRTASRIAHGIALALALLALIGCSDDASSSDGSLDFTYRLTINYSEYSISSFIYYDCSIYLSDSDGYLVAMPGSYPALYTVSGTDGSTHSTETIVTVGGEGHVSDVIMYINGYQETQYLLTAADTVSESDPGEYWLLTASGERVTEEGEYTAVLTNTVEEYSYDGISFSAKTAFTVTVNEDGIISGLSASSDDTDDNRYICTVAYAEDEGWSVSLTDLDGNEVTEDGTYIAAISMSYLLENDYSSSYDINVTIALTGYVTVSDGEVEAIALLLI